MKVNHLKGNNKKPRGPVKAVVLGALFDDHVAKEFANTGKSLVLSIMPELNRSGNSDCTQRKPLPEAGVSN